MPKSNQPDKTFRIGWISAAVWRNEDDEGRTNFVVRVQKSVVREDGQRSSTDRFFPNELPQLQLVLAKAYEHVSLRTQAK